MESLTKPIKLLEIVYPVYKLGKTPPLSSGGVAYYETEYMVDEQLVKTYKIIDDKNIFGTTLGLRRLKLRDKKVVLHNIKNPLYSLAQLIQAAKSNTWFIDNHGKIFQHKKTTRAKLLAKRIQRILSTGNLGYIIEVEDIGTRFKCLNKPSKPYAGILEFGTSVLLYDFYDEYFEPTWRLI